MQLETNGVRLDTGPSRLVLRNATGSCHANLAKGEIQFAAAGPRRPLRLPLRAFVETPQAGRLRPLGDAAPAWRPAKAEFGTVQAVEFSRPVAAGFRLHWYIAAAANGFVVRIGVSGGSEPVVALGLASEVKFLSAARAPQALRVAYCGAHSRSPLSQSEVVPVNPGTPVRSWWVSAWFDQADEAGFVLGFLSARRFAGRLDLAGASGTVWHPVERMRPPGRGVLWGEPLWVAPSSNVREALREYGRCVGRVNGSGGFEEPVWGWGSWGHFADEVNAPLVLANARTLRELQVPANAGPLLHIDHGWEEQFRTHRPKPSWRPRPEFGSGLPALARRLQVDGGRLGLWVVPFAINAEGPLPRAWHSVVLRDADGRPQPVGGPGCYCVDPTSPAGEAWLRRLFGRLGRMGAGHLKLDFLRVLLAGSPDDPVDGLTQPRRFHRAMTRLEAYRNGLGIIRDAVGPQVHLLACGAPLLPSAGLVNSCRIGSDIEAEWGRGRAGIGQCAENARCNFFWHGQVWRNDPDFLVVPADRKQLRHWAAAVAFSGGPALVSADLPRLSAGQRKELGRFMPALTGAPWPLELSPRAGITRISQTLQAHGETVTFVALFNADRQRRSSQVSLDELAPKTTGSGHAWDVMAGCPLGRPGRNWRVVVPARGVRIVCLRPVLGRPQLAGTSGHIGMEQTELSGVSWHAPTRQLRCQRSETRPWPERIYFHVPDSFRPAPGSGVRVDRRTGIGVARLRGTRSPAVGFSFLSNP